MKKFLLVLLIVLLVAGATNVVQFFYWKNDTEALQVKLNEDLAKMQLLVDSVGEEVMVYQLITSVESGQEVKAEDFGEAYLPSSYLTESMVTDYTPYVGQLYKVNLDASTVVQKSHFMERAYDDTLMDIDILINRKPVGLKVGDFINIRLTYPMGEDFIVLPYIRVEGVNDTTLKVYLTETQYHTYQGALVDYYLTSDLGSDLWCSKYVYPGLQAPAIQYYAVPANVENVMLTNPNITFEAYQAVDEEIRERIDTIIESVDTDKANKIASHRDELTAATESDVLLDNTVGEEDTSEDVYYDLSGEDLGREVYE